MPYILIADDEPFNRILLEEILASNYELGFAEDGIECLESIATRCPDLLLLDVAMPRMNGLDVCKHLRSSDNTASIPVFMISAYASKTDIANGKDAGADKYISKPFDPDDLLLEIRNLLGC